MSSTGSSGRPLRDWYQSALDRQPPGHVESGCHSLFNKTVREGTVQKRVRSGRQDEAARVPGAVAAAAGGRHESVNDGSPRARRAPNSQAAFVGMKATAVSWGTSRVKGTCA